jgi:hypothetical protein
MTGAQAVVSRNHGITVSTVTDTYSSLGLIPAESNIVPFWERGQIAQWLNQASHGPLHVAILGIQQYEA